jgi:hypothetical protein
MTAFARWVSIFGHPFAMVVIMVTGASLHSRTPAAAARILPIVILVAVVPVAVLMVRQVRRGSWKNADASHREERPLLFAICILGVVSLLACLWLTQPQSFVIRGAVGSLGMLVISAIATRWLKVSLHMAFAALGATTLVLLGSAIGWILLAGLPVLAWSRLALSRHSLTEVMTGALIGFSAAVMIYTL